MEADDILLGAADEASRRLSQDQPISTERFEKVWELFRRVCPDFMSDSQDAVKYPGYAALAFSNTLYEVRHGITPYWDPAVDTGFRLRGSESPILRRSAILAEYRTAPRSGACHSIDPPVGGGIRYRRAASVPRNGQVSLEMVEQGLMLITSQAIYFGGHRCNFRLPFHSILRLEPRADGIGIYPADGSGTIFLPASLGFDDGWFFYNLIAALSAA